MIDSLAASLERAKTSRVLDQLGLKPKQFGVLTLHRPSNVDDEKTLLGIMEVLHGISEELPIVFSCHPRTAQRLKALHGYDATRGDLRILEPLGYLDFLRLYSQSRIVLTDSGGLQEETTYLRHPLRHDPREHRAADHAHRGHERARRQRPRPDPGRGPRGAPRRLPPGETGPGFVGRAHSA